MALFYPLTVFLAAALTSTAVGIFSAYFIENNIVQRASELLSQNGLAWASAKADGRLVEVTGTYPNLSRRLAALDLLRNEFGETRVTENTRRSDDFDSLYQPSLQLLKSEDSVVVLGLLTSEDERSRVFAAVRQSAPSARLETMLNVLPINSSAEWKEALEFAVGTFHINEVVSIGITNNAVEIAILADSRSDGQSIQTQLEELNRNSVEVDFLLSAPRPNINPFAFRAEFRQGSVRLTTCYTEDEGDRELIFAAAASGGRQVTGSCRLARGAPDEFWAEAIQSVLQETRVDGSAVLSAEGKSITLWSSDEATFSHLNGRKYSDLPAGYRLFLIEPELRSTSDDLEIRQATLVVKIDANETVELTGTVSDAESHRAISLAAMANLGVGELIDNLRIDESQDDLTVETVLRVLEVISDLHTGYVALSGGSITVQGNSAELGVDELIKAKLVNIEPEKRVSVNVKYDATINAAPPPMDPRRCIQLLEDAQAIEKISFDPGSTMVRATSLPTINKIAEILTDCTHVPIEISGHTDNQGRESMNLRLSSARARAVLDAIINRGVVSRNLISIGYGESSPIADNKTKEGREQNRRIEFQLLDGVHAVPQ